MNWKDLLKPTIEKFITALIITLIVILELTFRPHYYELIILTVIFLIVFLIIYIITCVLVRIIQVIPRKILAILVLIIIIIGISWIVQAVNNDTHGRLGEGNDPIAMIVFNDSINTTGISAVNVVDAEVFTIRHKGGDTLKAGDYYIRVRKHGGYFIFENQFIAIPIDGTASEVIIPDRTFRLKLRPSAIHTNLTFGTTMIVETATAATTPVNVLGIYDIQVVSYRPTFSVIVDSNVEIK